MCGIPSSGKTTLSKQLALEYNAILYCYDILPRKHWSDDNHPMMYRNIIQDLFKGNVVICDDLHITKKCEKG